MPTPRWKFSATVVSGKIYAIGGYNKGAFKTLSAKRFSTVEVYDPQTNEWTREAHMPTRRAAHAVSVVDGRFMSLVERTKP